MIERSYGPKLKVGDKVLLTSRPEGDRIAIVTKNTGSVVHWDFPKVKGCYWEYFIRELDRNFFLVCRYCEKEDCCTL